MTVSFRNRIILSSGLCAPDDVTERELSPEGRVVLYGPGPGEPIHNASELRVYGWNYPTPNDALVAGRLWRDHVSIAFAHFDIGVELGPEDERAVIPEYGYGGPCFFPPPDQEMRDVPKLLIFRSGQEPQSSGLSAQVQRLLSLDRFVTGPIAWVTEHPHGLDRQQQLAYSLFHASYFEDNEETRHILLVTAIEAMLPPKRKLPDNIVGVLDKLMARLDEIDPRVDNIRERLARILEESKFEGIARRGRSLVGVLGTERFSGEKPKDYFQRMYDWRGFLVHGNLDRPTYVELETELRELRRFVLALLDQMVFGERMPTTWP